MLPKVTFPTRKLELEGGVVELRALSVHEVRQIQEIDDANRSDATGLAISAGVTVDEADEWLSSVPADIAALVVRTILELSGIDEGASKSG